MKIYNILIIIAITLLFSADLYARQDVSDGSVHMSKGEHVAAWLQAKGIPPDLVVLIIAMLPIVELRGAIPVAMGFFKMSIPHSFLLCVLGNMIPVPFILLLLGPVSRILSKVKIFDRFFQWLFARTRKRSDTIKKYQELGLIAFIAVPLPVTGAWTGSLAAFLFGLRFWPSLLCALAGVSIAGVIVTTLSALGWIGAAIAGAALIGISAVGIFSKRAKTVA